MKSMVSVKCGECFVQLIKCQLLSLVSLIIQSVAVVPVRFLKLNVQVTCVLNVEMKLFPVL
jgi:hypothetical protein